MSTSAPPHHSCRLSPSLISARPASRRGFIRGTALAAGAALLGSPLMSMRAVAGHSEALVLSCMDYRLLDDIVRYMDGRDLTNNYDQVILAGASLGATNDRFPAWAVTFWEHLGLSLELHHVNSLLVLDHRDCGAYKALLGEDFAANPERETEIHAEHMEKLRAAVGEKYPALRTELLLMSLDGSVETIS